MYEPKKTQILTTETLDCDSFLVNQRIDSVLNTVRSWITKGKFPKRNAESRQCKSVLGYANQYKKMFVDKETQLVCCKSKHSPKQICLPRNRFNETLNVAHDRRLLSHPVSEKSLMSLKRFSYWPRITKWVQTLTESCLTCRKNKQIRKVQNTAPTEKWGGELLYQFHNVYIDHKGPLNSMSDGKHPCLLVTDAFLRFIHVYPVKYTDSIHTIEAKTTSVFSFGIPQKLA